MPSPFSAASATRLQTSTCRSNCVPVARAVAKAVDAAPEEDVTEAVYEAVRVLPGSADVTRRMARELANNYKRGGPRYT